MTVAAHCVRCGTDFETADAYGEHLNFCSAAVDWRTPKFRERNAEEIPFGELRFGESTFEEPAGSTVAPDSQRERIDGALRSGRIRSVQWEPEQEPSVWRRMWNAIRGK